MKVDFVLFCIVALAVGVLAREESCQKIEKLDKGCAPIFPMKGLNMTWVKSVDKWYIPGADRPLWDLLLEGLTSPATLKKMDDKQKLQVCMQGPSFKDKENFYYKIEGVEPTYFKPNFNPIRIGEIDWTAKVNGKDEFLCAVTIVDSDNESYFIGYEYWPTGQRGIWVSSVEKTVPQKVHDIAMEKMELLAGFTNAKEQYLKMDNSKCTQ